MKSVMRSSRDRLALMSFRSIRWMCCLLLCATASLAAQDWPQFRGPGGQGQSTERGLRIEWSESKNVAWKVPVPGRGWSSPVVAGGRVWLTTATAVERDTSLRLLAFDAGTGVPAVDVEV